jgi:hypothetical protein
LVYCPNCGQQNADDSKFCQHCGTSLTEPVEVSETPSIPQAEPSRPDEVPRLQYTASVTRNSGMAIASLVLGIVSYPLYFIAIFPGALAIIFGAVSIGQINRDPSLGGKGMAVAGLVLGIIAVAFWVLVVIFASSIIWLYA